MARIFDIARYLQDYSGGILLWLTGRRRKEGPAEIIPFVHPSQRMNRLPAYRGKTISCFREFLAYMHEEVFKTSDENLKSVRPRFLAPEEYEIFKKIYSDISGDELEQEFEVYQRRTQAYIQELSCYLGEQMDKSLTLEYYLDWLTILYEKKMSTLFYKT